jgi:hypothetical protein
MFGTPMLAARRPLVGASFAVVFAGIALSLFGTWEMNGETWGYWYFARLFHETGLLGTWDRSPAYVLYLAAFTLLGYPLSVTVEYVVTSTIFCGSFLSLFYGSRQLPVAALAALVLLPAAWTAAPNSQILAVSCILAAFGVLMSRQSQNTRLAAALFLLTLAYLFRSTYVAAMPLVVLFLVFSPYVTAATPLRRAIVVAKCAAPAILFLAAFWTFSRTHETLHPWSNVFFTSTEWFPVNVRSLFDSGVVAHLNWIYAEETYPNQKGIDFYRTNQELFQGARTAYDAFAANPRFVLRALALNTVSAFQTIALLTPLPYVAVKLGIPATALSIVFGIIVFALVAAITVTQYFRIELRLLFVCVTAVAFTSILAMPKPRYFMCMAPVFFFVCLWGVDRAYAVRDRLAMGRSERAGPGAANRRGYLAWTCALFVLVSYGTVLWTKVLIAPARAAPILENDKTSLKRHYSEFVAASKGCRGIMTLEHTYMAAFVTERDTRVYDVFEIPPFGNLQSSPYRGLNPQRVDCVFVSNELLEGNAYGTEIFHRYHQYIEPYAESLLKLGGTKTAIPGYGHVVALKKRG